ncbi:thiamine pyrophosphate-dependent enzyme [Bradyrhizobium sp. 170]|uniref:thiamine pyrophosphate-dependent enzyme n=1 Tax=Bradyrhizobium sp. 170 TaxID=2782641 RepID=UPI001FFE6B9B|nr:thiamine pyrophosphate-dependent enzyme [Bradyrhizobium sp. 170]
MTANELATAVARRLNIRIVISNNQSYGTIRTRQERAFPKRPGGAGLSNPDFATLARAFGAQAIRSRAQRWRPRSSRKQCRRTAPL